MSKLPDRLINYTEGPEFERRKKLQDRLTRELFAAPSTRPFLLSVTGSGDPFASRMFREFLFEIDGAGFPNLKVNLQTNGILLTPRNWNRIRGIHGNLGEVIVSFDAASERTYGITRRGGRWQTLLENTAYLGERRRSGEFDFLRLDLWCRRTISTRCPISFVSASNSARIRSHSLWWWIGGLGPPQVFRDKCVWRSDHPQFGEFLRVLRDPAFDDPIVAWGNVTEYRGMALDPTLSM